MKKNLHRSSSVYKPKQSKTALKNIWVWILMWETTRDGLSHCRKHYYGLWTCLMLDLFQLLSSPDVNWWTGVVWIIVMFLSAVWTLILTAPIHCRASIAETVMQSMTHFSKSDEETIFHFYFWWTIPLSLYMFLSYCELFISGHYSKEEKVCFSWSFIKM